MEGSLLKNYMSPSLWAWEFLRRNPEYRSDWSRLPSTYRQYTDHPFSLTRQESIDREAVKWGLLAYENPDNTSRRATPFWAIGPTIDAEIAPNGDLPLLPMLRKSGVLLSGLQLLGGGMVLTIRRDNASLQLIFSNKQSFDDTDGVILRLPLNMGLPVRFARSLDLWNIATGKKVKKTVAAARLATTISFLSLTA